MRRRDQAPPSRTLVWVAAAALASRLLWLAWAPFTLANDAADYHRLAANLAQHGTFGPSALAPAGGPTAFRPPFWPIILSFVYRVAGVHVTAGRLLNVALGVGVVVLTGVVGRQWFSGRVAMIAAGIAAFYPPLLSADTSLMSEPLALLLLLGAVALLKWSDSTEPPRWTVPAAGLLLGGAILTRPITAAAIPVLIVVAWRSHAGEPGRSRMRAGLATTAVVVLSIEAVLLPWQVRNAREFHEFVPLTTQTGLHLAGVYNENAQHDALHPAQWRLATADPAIAMLFKDRTLDEVRLDSRVRSYVADFVRDNPTYVPRVAFYNFRRLFDLNGWETVKLGESFGYGQGAQQAALELAGFLVAAVLAALGLTTRAARRAGQLWLIPVSLAIPAILITAEVRFRQPLEPFILLAAALGVDCIRERHAT